MTIMKDELTVNPSAVSDGQARNRQERIRLFEENPLPTDELHLTRGSVIGFDELNYAIFPGGTQALREVFGIDRFRIRRSRFSHIQSYVIFE